MGEAFQFRGEVPELARDEAASTSPVVTFGREVAEGLLVPAAEVGRHGRELLNRIAGVGEQYAVDHVGAASGDEGEAVTHNRADVALDASGLRAPGRPWRTPHLDRQNVHCRQDFLRVVDRQNSDRFPAVCGLLLLDVSPSHRSPAPTA